MQVIGRIARTKDRPERLALLRTDGTVSNYFACDQTRQDVAAILAANGFTLLADDTVATSSTPQHED